MHRLLVVTKHPDRALNPGVDLAQFVKDYTNSHNLVDFVVRNDRTCPHDKVCITEEEIE